MESTFHEGTDFHGEESAHSNFDFDGLDSIEDKIREALSKGQSVTALVAEIVHLEVQAETTAAISRVLCMIADARKPKLVIDHIAYATGLPMTQGQSATALARKHKVTKQAFSQAAMRIVKALGLRSPRAMRSLKGRESMAAAYRRRVEQGKVNA